jgi:lysyl-tRNA synthetase class 2
LESKDHIKIPGGFDNNFSFRRRDFLPTLESQIREKIPSFKMPPLSLPEAYTQLADVANKLEIHISNPTDTQLLPHILDILASHLIEPLCVEPTFITHYPAIMSPLAKSSLTSDSQRIARRAELFINGTEYANLYEEENDPYQQTKNFLQQASFNDATAEPVNLDVPYDELFQQLSPSQKYYVRVLELGLPPTGGWGCGIDRLVMLFGGASRIGDVLPFGNLRNVVAMGT